MWSFSLLKTNHEALYSFSQSISNAIIWFSLFPIRLRNVEVFLDVNICFVLIYSYFSFFLCRFCMIFVGKKPRTDVLIKERIVDSRKKFSQVIEKNEKYSLLIEDFIQIEQRPNSTWVLNEVFSLLYKCLSNTSMYCSMEKSISNCVLMPVENELYKVYLEYSQTKISLVEINRTINDPT